MIITTAFHIAPNTLLLSRSFTVTRISPSGRSAWLPTFAPEQLMRLEKNTQPCLPFFLSLEVPCPAMFCLHGPSGLPRTLVFHVLRSEAPSPLCWWSCFLFLWKDRWDHEKFFKLPSPNLLLFQPFFLMLEMNNPHSSQSLTLHLVWPLTYSKMSHDHLSFLFSIIFSLSYIITISI